MKSLIFAAVSAGAVFASCGAQWISAKDAPVFEGSVHDGSRAADGTSWFAFSLTNAAEVASARWTTAGLGVYEVYLNGKAVGDHFLKPGFTHNAKTKYSFAYDVTDLLDRRPGAVNDFAAEVSAGWWRDRVCSPDAPDGFVGRKSAFYGVIEVAFSDGTRRTYGTNARDWRAGTAGSVTHAAIFDGEEFDARIPQPYRGEGLGEAEENLEFAGEILPTDGAEVHLRRDLEMRPASAYAWRGSDGSFDGAYGTVRKTREFDPGGALEIRPGESLVVDFGQNAAAIPFFRFRAAAGTVLTALPAEMLNDRAGDKARGNDGPEGSVYRVNLRESHAKGHLVRYTFAGTGVETYHPRFTYFGYRYISLSATAPVTVERLTSVPVSSVTKDMERGRIEVGEKDVNRLISNVYWGHLSNYLSVPTDCPQRNERLGWSADTQVFAETATFNADVRGFLGKWMRDMRDGQHGNGSFAAVAPVALCTDYADRFGWSDAGIVVPYVLWLQYGDTDAVRTNWAAMNRHFGRMCETKGATLPGNSQWADWLSYERYQPANAPWRANPPKEVFEYWDFLGACYWLWDAQMMAAMAKGIGVDAAAFEKTAAEALAHIRRRFVADDGLLSRTFRDLQTACLFALKLGLVEGEARRLTAETLAKGIADHGGCLQTGFLGTSILMDTLAENGMSALAYDLLLQHRNPSWLYSVDQGATTVWERWNSYTLDSGFGPVGMNSFNHYAYGAVLAWIYKSAAGIAADPEAPGFHNVIMAPKPDRRLGFVKAEYRSAAGMIRSAWRYEDADWIWEFEIPDGATATVTVPGERPVKYGSGRHRVQRPAKE